MGEEVDDVDEEVEESDDYGEEEGEEEDDLNDDEDDAGAVGVILDEATSARLCHWTVVP